MKMSRDAIDHRSGIWSKSSDEEYSQMHWSTERQKKDMSAMNISKRWIPATAAVALVAAWFAHTANAAFVNYQIGNGGLETFNITWDGNTENALAGGIRLTRMGGEAGMPGNYVTVCTDVGATLYLGSTYGYSSPAEFLGQDGIRPTWGAGNQSASTGNANAATAIQLAADLFYHHSGVLNGGSLSDRAALQLAVWEVLYDTDITSGIGSLNLGEGRFSVNSGDLNALATASRWLSQVSLTANYTGYLLMPDPTEQFGLPAQGLLFNVTPVPEMTTMLAGALLLLPFSVSTLRILRRNRGT